MFRPGNLGHLGRLGLVAASRPSLVAQALAILAKYGSASNLYLPGVGAISGITAGNWLDTVGGTPATVDGAVGAVVNALGGVNMTQATPGHKPILRLSGASYFWDFVSSDFLGATLTAGDSGFFCSSINPSSLGATRAIYSAGQHTSFVAGARYRVAVTGEIALIAGNGTVRDIFTSTAQVSAGQTSVVSAGWNSTTTALIGVGLTEQSFTKTTSYAGTTSSQLGIMNVSSEPFAGLIGSTVIMQSALPDATERAILRRFVGALSGVTL